MIEKFFLEYLFFQIHSLHLQAIIQKKDEYDFGKRILVAILTTPAVVRSNPM